MVRYGKVGKGNEAYKKDNLDEALAYYTQGTLRYNMVSGTVW